MSFNNGSLYVPGDLKVDGTITSGGGGGGGLGGSIADQQVAFGSGTDIAGSNSLTWDNNDGVLNAEGSIAVGTLVDAADDGDIRLMNGASIQARNVDSDGNIDLVTSFIAGGHDKVYFGPYEDGPYIESDIFNDKLSLFNFGGNFLSLSTTMVEFGSCLKLPPQADPPASPEEGMIYADTDHHLYYYNGTTWKQLDN